MIIDIFQNVSIIINRHEIDHLSFTSFNHLKSCPEFGRLFYYLQIVIITVCITVCYIGFVKKNFLLEQMFVVQIATRLQAITSLSRHEKN